MRLLYILPFVPWPLRVRSNNLIPRLAKEHEIYLLCLSGSAEEDARADLLQGWCRQIRVVRHRKARAFWQCALAFFTPVPLRMAYFASPSMREEVRRALAEFCPHLIYCERWRALQYVPEGVGIPVICDPTDSMLLYNRRLMRNGLWWERAIGLEESLKFSYYEPELALEASAVVFCSDIDLECVRRNAPSGRYCVVPNGVDKDKFFFKRPDEEEPDLIVFAGNFGYGPNRHAARFFLEQVFPIIRREIPQARFLAVGRKAKEFIHKNRFPMAGIESVDYVPDLRPYIARATVAVAPIQLGVGVNNKLAEAFSAGTPVVATRVACGDLAVSNGEHLLMADDPHDFAMKVAELLRNPALRRNLAIAARKLVEQRYDWNIVYPQLERLMLDLVKNHGQFEEHAIAAAP